VSLKKIAQLTGLSIATVSHALNGTRAVSDESREKILQAAKEVGYKPNIAARTLRIQKSNTIAIIIPSDIGNTNANYFYMDVIMGLRKKMMETNYELIVSTYDPHGGVEKSLPSAQVLRQHWVDGVIVVPSSHSQRQIKSIREMGLPYVLLDRRSDDDSSCVTSDNQKGAADAVRLFAACGKRRIGFIGGTGTATGRQRYSGYMEALETLGLPIDDSLIRLFSSYSLDQGEQGARWLLASGVDAILAADNVMMMGTLCALKTDGIRIPEEVGVIGFDDFDWMDMLSPPLTTVKQQAYQMGYIAAEVLLRKLSGIDTIEVVVLDTTLVVRESHGICSEQPANSSILMAQNT